MVMTIKLRQPEGAGLMARACFLLTVLAAAVHAGPFTISPNHGLDSPADCPRYEVGPDKPILYFSLWENSPLIFHLQPSHPLLLVRVMVGDTLYKASVDGNMLRFQGCDLEETNCTMIDSGGSKSPDLVHAHYRNTVTVTFLNDQIMVDVNMETNVMAMEGQGVSKGGVVGEVAIVNVDPHASVRQQSLGYSANVTLSCNVTHMPYFREVTALPMPDITTVRVLMDRPPKSDCSPYEVSSDEHIQYITVKEGTPLTFYLQPSHPWLMVRVTVGFTLYKVSVDGSMLELLECDILEANCTTRNEVTSKDAQLIHPNHWNEVTILLDGGELVVEINMVTSVMDIVTTGISEVSMESEVAIVSEPPHSTQHQMFVYLASVIVFCNDTVNPTIRDSSLIPIPEIVTPRDSGIITITSMPVHPAPYPWCGVPTVETDHPYSLTSNGTSLALAVFPSHPTLNITITLSHIMYKVIMNGSNAEVFKCSVLGDECQQPTLTFGNPPLHVSQWNSINIDVAGQKLTVMVNEGMVISESILTSDTPSSVMFILTVLATTDLPAQDSSSYYSVVVNPSYCKEATHPPHVSKEPTTTCSPPAVTSAPATGSSRTVGIVVGLLVAALVVVAVAVLISTYKKRRSAQINSHTPMQESQQTL